MIQINGILDHEEDQECHFGQRTPEEIGGQRIDTALGRVGSQHRQYDPRQSLKSFLPQPLCCASPVQAKATDETVRNANPTESKRQEQIFITKPVDREGEPAHGPYHTIP